LSLEKELINEMNKTLKECREIVEKIFEPYSSYAKEVANWCSEISKIADKSEAMFEYRTVDAVTIEDLRLLSSLIALQSKAQNHIATISARNVEELKETAFQIIRIALYTAVKIIVNLSKIIPKESVQFRKTIEEKIRMLEKEIQRLKTRKVKVRLQAKKDIIKTIKEIEKILKEAKEKQKQYIA